MKKKVLKNNYTIKSYEIDLNKRIKIHSILNLFQEIASNHADNLNVGYKDIHKNNLSWILSRIFIKIYKYPVWNQKIVFTTYPSGFNRLFAFRDFIITDIYNNKLVESTSNWILVNFKENKPIRMDDYFKDKNIFIKDSISNYSCDKINYEGNHLSSNLITVMYNDIDLNNHVNNAKYIEWIINQFSDKLNNNYIITDIQVNFLSSAVLNDEIEVQLIKSDNEIFIVKAINIKSKEIIFNSKLCIEKSKDI